MTLVLAIANKSAWLVNGEQKFGLIYVNLHCSILKVFKLSSWIFPTFPKSIAWAVKPMNATKNRNSKSRAIL